MFHLKINTLIPLLLGLMIAGGCNTIKTASVPPLQMPSSFPGATDTASIATVSWRTFFQDQTLVSLIDTALKNNPDLIIALQRIAIAEAKLKLSKGAFLPSLGVAASASIDRYGEYTMNGVGNYDTDLSPNVDKDHSIPDPTPDFFIGLRSSWEIDIWGKLRSRKKAAWARYLATTQGQQWLKTQMVSRVATTYYTLLALDNQQSILRRNIALQQNALEIVEAQMAGGRATALAVQQFKAQKLHTQSTLLETLQQVVKTENALNTLLGRFPGGIARTDSLISQPLPSIMQVGIPANTLLTRPDIKQAELQLSATKADVQAARKAFFPSVSLTSYGGYNAFKMPFLFSPASAVYGFLGGLSAPLFNKNVLKSGLRVANASQTSAFYNYQKTVLQGYGEVMTAMSAMQNYRDVYNTRSEEVQTLTQAVNTAGDLYLGGYASYLEVITAQRNVLEAELLQTQDKRRVFDTMISLYCSLGGGWK